MTYHDSHRKWFNRVYCAPLRFLGWLHDECTWPVFWKVSAGMLWYVLLHVIYCPIAIVGIYDLVYTLFITPSKKGL